jgi:pyruvate dehydrogenase E2 component (dihydrolipoamide acetyltransferase)
MSEAILMPRLGETVDEATIEEWLVQVGDAVELGQPIALIETDKAQVEVESVAEGTVIDLVAQAGDTVPCGQVIAHIGSADELVAK